jgi:glycosyltransferase involved in cell wall biosynthesis
MKHYASSFFEHLAARLAKRDVALTVAYSEPNRREASKLDTVELDAQLGRKVPGYWLLGNRLFLQSVFGLVKDADLVVVEQENKQLVVYPLLALSRLQLKKVAFWGHGLNRQETAPGLSEWLKRRLVNKVDWWFSYGEDVTRYLIEKNVRAETITTFYNTTDTSALTGALSVLQPHDLAARRRRLGIDPAARLGLFCGSLYAGKNFSFLFDAVAQIRRREPDFALLVVGDGPERPAVEAAQRDHAFIHYVGPQFGSERAIYFAMSELFLITGLLGLAIVDAFAAGLPVVTTDLPTHGPEIEYLQPEINGLKSRHDVVAYADAVVAVLHDRERLQRMRRGALASAARLDLSAMVERFADGIVHCLREPPR